MNNQLETALQGMMDTLSDGKEFVLEQAPLVCQEYIQYTLVQALFVVAIQLVIFTGATYYLLMFIKKGAADSWDKGSNAVGTFCATVVLVTLMFPAFMTPTHRNRRVSPEDRPAYQRALKAQFAPRVLLLEKATHLLRGEK